jgi:hypothetical protein
MKITKKTVGSYSESFDNDQVHAVQQWLDAFGVCGELREAVEEVISARQEAARVRAEGTKVKYEKIMAGKMKEYEQQELMASEESKFPGEPGTLPVIGFCPKCGSYLRGIFVADCEKRKSGRHMIKECGSCDYYSEIFKKRNKYIETEGG